MFSGSNLNQKVTGVMPKVFDFIFGTQTTTTEEPRRILCTGNWRQCEERRLLLEAHLTHPITVVTQEDEGILQAQCAHRIMMNERRIEHSGENNVYLYLGAGRGSTQFTLLNHLGEFVNAYNVPTGYPKIGVPDISLLDTTAVDIFNTFGDSITMIVGFDSIYHVLSKSCPVIPDNSVLADTITKTTCNDFNELGYLTNLYPNTSMIVVRNFITTDGYMRKISFATGDELLIDLGTGNANLVDPLSGTQFETRELPGDWMTNDTSLIKTSNILKELLQAADQYDINDSDEESDNEAFNLH